MPVQVCYIIDCLDPGEPITTVTVPGPFDVPTGLEPAVNPAHRAILDAWVFWATHGGVPQKVNCPVDRAIGGDEIIGDPTGCFPPPIGE